MNRPYTHPGEILLEEFVKPYKLTQEKLSSLLGVGIKTISMLLCLLTTTATACKDNEEMDFTVNEEESVGLTASSKAIMIGKDGGTATFTVSSGYNWNIYGGAEWCTLDVNSGKSGETREVTLTAQRNEGEVARFTTLYVRSGFDKIDIPVVQPGANYKDPDQTGMQTDMFDLVYSINNGWNLGNTMEAWVSWDLNNEVLGTGESMETAWGNPVVTPELIKCVYEHGFRGIRIPCKWDAYYMDMKDPAKVDYKIHPDWFKRMKLFHCFLCHAGYILFGLFQPFPCHVSRLLILFITVHRFSQHLCCTCDIQDIVLYLKCQSDPAGNLFYF